MAALTVGANLGVALATTLGADSDEALQIALVQLLFNVLGLAIWFPVPAMWRILLRAPQGLGFYAAFWRAWPPLYIVSAFLLLPGALLGICLLFNVSIAAGAVVAVLAALLVVAFLVWWNRGGCYKVVSQEQRQERHADLLAQAGIGICSPVSSASIEPRDDRSEDSCSIYSYRGSLDPLPGQRLGKSYKARCCLSFL
ncbi:unnamed protein product [Effrenium voratum]|uniref:Uncharacterized protein n=1 Tax=Effrenium voratum TaxID=2562239 RepID=A0AA36N2R5_9DINO|nr:unnamed protein product [Effrenium voratum]